MPAHPHAAPPAGGLGPYGRDAGSRARRTWTPARRELLEEAGAQLLTFELFGAWHCRSSAPAPYRPHLPHPESYRVVGYGEVALVGAPTNPPDGEQVIEVACVYR